MNLDTNPTPVNDEPDNLPTASTPMMQQYHAMKATHPGCLLFFRLGDFYEMFFEDAQLAAKVLNITLTRRGKGGDGQEIPMCGVPVVSVDNYLQRLVQMGFKVALCEQMETPEQAKQRTGKSLVRRDVVRIITKGTLLEDSLLKPKAHNYLVSLIVEKNHIFAAYADISTGNLLLESLDKKTLASFLYRIKPSEILIDEKELEEIKEIVAEWDDILTIIDHKLQAVIESNATSMDLKLASALENINPFLQKCVRTLAAYVTYTQKGTKPRLNPPEMIGATPIMQIDRGTLKNLEIDNREGPSLFNTIDHTITAQGARRLFSCITQPLADAHLINERLNCVEYFVKNSYVRMEARKALKSIPDVERIISRVNFRKVSPRDLEFLKLGLNEIKFLYENLERSPNIPEVLNNILKILNTPIQSLDILNKAIENEAPNNTKDGDFIKKGYDQKLDYFKEIRKNHHLKLISLQEDYINKSGIAQLKIRHNNIIGYFIETPLSQSKKCEDLNFIHRQTLANNARFTTKELMEFETAIKTAEEDAYNLELKIFNEICDAINYEAERIISISMAIAKLDVMLNFAHIAVEYRYTKPIIDDSLQFEVMGGRHAIVERYLESNTNFIKNDCLLNFDSRSWLITGPNMAGKSTFLRQNALIAVLAQAGSFVPADKAHIGIVDKLFSRIGSGDDLARGQSTFMVEMLETANILHNATPKSLLILDELGRGTSTYDGLAIARSTLEYIHNKLLCRTLFATHYRELSELAEITEGIDCYTMSIKEFNNSLVFLYTIVKGVAEGSFGIHVAELAGIPEEVVQRARVLLTQLEQLPKQTNS